jgi:hypothetical protein
MIRLQSVITASLVSVAMNALALALFATSAHAGPCSPEIARIQSLLDTRLEAKAASGPTGQESAGALMHRQPTPGSIAAAEERLGDLSSQTTAIVAQALVRARAADDAGDKHACEQALADVQSAIGH